MKLNKIIALALIALSAPAAYALPAAQVLNIAMSGSIPPVCNYTFGAISSVASPTAPGVASVSLLLSGTQETLGSISVTCNNSNGYTINASSTNASKLQLPATAGGIPYTIGVDANVAASISPSSAILTRLAGAGNENAAAHVMKINYASNPQAIGSTYPSGAYSDTIMLSMQAN